ncbi:MAG: tRNA lysidine(34) synthetase TilS [Actinomycetota bacterium]
MTLRSDSFASILDRCHFPPPTSCVACAVSGGADSLALMALAVRHGLEVTAIHVDHGLRPGSADEADLVATCAREVGASFEARRVTVEPGPNIEARARAARYSVLPDDVLTGHTADDRVETVVINLLRGASTSGLVGMNVTGGPSGRVLHPLLHIRRHETRAVCAELGWTPFEDPSNVDLGLLRNRVRHDVLPLLVEVAGRDLVDIVSRQADLVADDDALLDSLARALDPTDARALCAAPLPLARRAIRAWLTTDHPPDAATVERVLAVARGEAVACEIPGGNRVQRKNQRLFRNGPVSQD